MSLNVFIIFVLLPHIQGELNFNNDLVHNQKFKSIPTTIKTYENHTVLLPCERDSKLWKIPQNYIPIKVDLKIPQNDIPI